MSRLIRGAPRQRYNPTLNYAMGTIGEQLGLQVSPEQFYVTTDADDWAPAITRAIAFLSIRNAFGVTSIGYGRGTLRFDTKVYLCKSPVVFDPFINYKGSHATTVDVNSNFTDLSQTRGTVLRAHTSLYNAAAAVGSNARGGVLCQVNAGDCLVEGITFVGTAAINSNPSVGIRLGSPAYTNNCQGISFTNVRVVAAVIALDLYAALIESAVRFYTESCTTAIVSNAASPGGIGNEGYFSNCYFGAYVNGLTMVDGCDTKLFFTNTIFKPNNTLSRDVQGSYGALTTINLKFTGCNFDKPFTGAAAAYSIYLAAYTDSAHRARINCANCDIASPVLIAQDAGGGSKNYKHVTFTGCTITAPTFNATGAAGVKLIGNDFIDTVVTLDGAKRGAVIGNHFEMSTDTSPLVLANAAHLAKIIGNSVSDNVSVNWPTFAGADSVSTIIGNDQNSGANTDYQRFGYLTAAAVPANFTASKILKFKDITGVVYDVPAQVTPW